MPPPHHPPKKPQIPLPLPDPIPHPTVTLRLKIRDLSHSGSALFLDSVNASFLLSEAVHTVLSLLYPQATPTSPDQTTKPTPPWPGTRSTSLILHDFSGVAYTTGSSLDNDHKEIHLSLSYVADSISPSRLTPEIRGVIVHETVHAWQWNALGSAPGGLIEGIADWVRLKAGLAPPHWDRFNVDDGDKWDGGYQLTAWFLDYLGEEVYQGQAMEFVPMLNGLLRDESYEEEEFWVKKSGLGKGVEELWDQYRSWLEKQKGPDDESSDKSEEDEPRAKSVGDDVAPGEGQSEVPQEQPRDLKVNENPDLELENSWTKIHFKT